MSWQNSAIFVIDFTAVLAGVLIAAPFVVILSIPFLGGY